MFYCMAINCEIVVPDWGNFSFAAVFGWDTATGNLAFRPSDG